ncbi:MAG: ribokinase [Firmicutes bacterium]|nr:ribokinase [Bacillota bacterium]
MQETKKVFVAGSLNIDLVSYVSRMPKAGETMTGDGFLTNVGGKGLNQATASAKLGAPTYMIGAVGSDPYGAMLKDTLGGFGANVDFVTTLDGSSGTAVIVVCKGQNSIILSGGANSLLKADYVTKILKDNAKAGDIFLTQLETPLDTTIASLKMAKSLGMTTILNPAPAVKLPKEIFQSVDILTPNETETEILTGIMPDCEVNIALAVKRLYGYGVGKVVITLGSQGIAVIEGQTITPIPAVKIKAVDTTGAGDTFVGAMVAEMSRGTNFINACHFGIKAAALTCLKKGAASSVPTLAEYKEYYNE